MGTSHIKPPAVDTAGRITVTVWSIQRLVMAKMLRITGGKPVFIVLRGGSSLSQPSRRTKRVQLRMLNQSANGEFSILLHIDEGVAVPT